MRRLILLLSFALFTLTALVTFAAVAISRAQPRESLLVYRSTSGLEPYRMLVKSMERDFVISLGFVSDSGIQIATVRNGQLAFSNKVGIEDGDIVFWDGETAPHTILNYPFSPTSPQIAPDGRIAFRNLGDQENILWIKSPVNDGLFSLGSSSSQYDWSQQGRLAFINEEYELFVYESDSSLTPITLPDKSIAAIAWGADGRLALYSVDDITNMPEIAIMENDGTINVIGEFQIYSGLFWSSNGWLAFDEYMLESRDIFVWKQGEPLRNVSNHPALDYTPTWSADGRLAFVSERDGNSEIYIWQLDGALTNISNHPADDEHPVWSADGKLAFTSNRDGNDEIYVWSAENGLQNMTNSPGIHDLKARWLDPPRP